MRHDFIDERIPRGISLDRLGRDDLSAISKSLGLTGKDQQRLLEHLADPVFLLAKLVKLPALCLVVLEVIVEAGGVVHDRSLHTLVSKRTGRSASEIETARRMLFGTGLVLGIGRGQGLAGTQTGVAAPAGRPLYALLAGVSLSDDAPANEPRSHEPNRRHRDLVALSTLAAHRKPRLTQRGVPDRVSVKRLVKGLGVEVDDAERALVLATRLGWMIRSHDGIAPNASALLKGARGEIEASQVDPLRCANLIAAEGWTNIEALERALSYASNASGYEYAFDYGSVQKHGVPAIAQQLAELPGLEVVEHAGAHFVRRRAATRVGGDGHVTPSFEVLLGPDADFATVVRVGLCCELLRVDHVLSFRLTPQSIAIGIACGLEPSELRAALASVGPHGLPENVAFMVDDWIKTSRFAQVRSGTFLFTDDATAERIATGLGGDVLSRPAQGVLELRASVAGSVLEKALAKAGVVLGASGSLRDVASQRRAERYADIPQADDDRSALRLLPLPQPDTDLRAIVMRARRSGDYGVKTVAAGESEMLLRKIESIARAQNAPAELFELIELLCKWQKRMPEELRAWIGRMPQAERVAAHAALELPLNVLPWLVLNEKWRLRALKMASDVTGLNRQAMAVSLAGRFRPEGERAMALLHKPQIMPAIERAFSEVNGRDNVSQDDLGEYCEECGFRHPVDEFDDAELDDGNDELDDDALDAAALGRQPPVGAMPRTTLETVLGLIGSATKKELALHLEVTDGGKTRMYSVRPEALRRRGREQVLLAIDLRSLDSRVFNLRDIAAARIDVP